MKAFSEQQIVDRLLESGPFADEREVRQALAAALEVLGSLLTSDERTIVADELSPALAVVLRDAVPHPRGDWHELTHRLAQLEGVRVGLAVEHAELVCQTLGDALSPSARGRLLRNLPELARLFERPERVEAPPVEAHRSNAAPSDLAEGRPGGAVPLASADPRYLAHTHSIARSDDPHGDGSCPARVAFAKSRMSTRSRSVAPGPAALSRAATDVAAWHAAVQRPICPQIRLRNQLASSDWWCSRWSRTCAVRRLLLLRVNDSMGSARTASSSRLFAAARSRTLSLRRIRC